MDAAQCIGCGACVAACPNGSASLFTAAKITHLGLLPQGQPERLQRARRMVEQMDVEGFGGCTLYGECQEACPKHDQHRHHHPHEPRLPPGRRRAGARGGGRVGLSRALALALALLALAPLVARRRAQQPAVGACRRAGGRRRYERADPVPGGSGAGRGAGGPAGRHAARRRAAAGSASPAMLNLEGATIPEGELAPGNWGEGFVDRRHPHTYVHELMLTADDLLGAARRSRARSRSARARDSRRSAPTIRWSGRSSGIP